MNTIPVCEAALDPGARFPLEKIMMSLKKVCSTRVNIMQRTVLTIMKPIGTMERGV